MIIATTAIIDSILPFLVVLGIDVKHKRYLYAK